MLEKNEMIFGVRAVIEAIQAGREIDKVLVKKRYTERTVQRTVCLFEKYPHPCSACTRGAY